MRSRLSARLCALVTALFLAGVTVGVAQVLAPAGQTSGGAINQNTFSNNSDAIGFNGMALTPSLAVPATSTAQAAWGTGSTTGQVVSGTLITTTTTVITTCSSTTGVTLPAVQRYVVITIINRSGGSCLVWPSVGATVETALGTNGAVNAPFTMLTNTDVAFRPSTATSWLQ